MMERALILLGGVLLFSNVADAQDGRNFFPTAAELAARCGEKGIPASIRAPDDGPENRRRALPRPSYGRTDLELFEAKQRS